MLLVIGNKNYSSWSLRPWLPMRCSGIAFGEVRIPLYTPGSEGADPRALARRPGARAWWTARSHLGLARDLRVPGRAPSRARAVAGGREARAPWHARSARRCIPASRTCGQHMSMNSAATSRQGPHAGSRRRDRPVQRLWADLPRALRRRRAVPVRPFCGADAMYAPVVLRFRTYQVQLQPGEPRVRGRGAGAARAAGVDRCCGGGDRSHRRSSSLSPCEGSIA